MEVVEELVMPLSALHPLMLLRAAPGGAPGKAAVHSWMAEGQRSVVLLTAGGVLSSRICSLLDAAMQLQQRH